MAPATEVEVTVVGARDLKNVNWKHGELRPYATLWLEGDDDGGRIAKVSTEADDGHDTEPRWGQRFTLTAPSNISRTDLRLQILHDDPEARIAKPQKAVVGTAALSLSEVADAGGFDETLDFTVKLKRPSGRPHGKVDIAVRLKEKRNPYPYPGPGHGQGYPSYEAGPVTGGAPSRDWAPPYPAPYGQAPPSYPAYPTTAPYPSYNQAPSAYGAPPPSGYGGYGQPQPGSYGAYGQPQPGSYGYGQPQPGGYGYGPSDYAGPVPAQDPPKKASKFGGLGTGLAVGALAGAVGGLALGEYVDHEENEAREEQAEEDRQLESAQDDYGGYGDDF